MDGQSSKSSQTGDRIAHPVVVSAIEPLSVEELNALKIGEFDYCAHDTEVCIDGTYWTTIHELRRLFDTVRDRERQRDEAEEWRVKAGHLEMERDELQRYLNAIAGALHPGHTEPFTYLPQQLAGMVEELQRQVAELMPPHVANVDLKHGMNCPATNPTQEDECLCGLKWRRYLQTEQTMHAVWRKRAEETERHLAEVRKDVERLDWLLKLAEALRYKEPHA